MAGVVWLLDTGVLCELLDVPGRSQQPATVKAKARELLADGDRFVLPVAAVIETGNHICNAKAGDRRAAAERFAALIEAVRAGADGWALHEMTWDDRFPGRLIDGSPDWERSMAPT